MIDGWSRIVRLQVNCVSRVRSESGVWDFYTDEDIVDGFLVFVDVERIELGNSGYLPNDSINSIEVVEQHEGSATVALSIDAVGVDATHHETFLRIRCGAMHLEDPSRPGVKITI